MRFRERLSIRMQMAGRDRIREKNERMETKRERGKDEDQRSSFEVSLRDNYIYLIGEEEMEGWRTKRRNWRENTREREREREAEEGAVIAESYPNPR